MAFDNGLSLAIAEYDDELEELFLYSLFYFARLRTKRRVKRFHERIKKLE